MKRLTPTPVLDSSSESLTFQKIGGEVVKIRLLDFNLLCGLLVVLQYGLGKVLIHYWNGSTNKAILYKCNLYL